MAVPPGGGQDDDWHSWRDDAEPQRPARKRAELPITVPPGGGQDDDWHCEGIAATKRGATTLNHNAPPGRGQNFQSLSRPEEGKTTIGTRAELPITVPPGGGQDDDWHCEGIAATKRGATTTTLTHNAQPGGGQNFRPSPARRRAGRQSALATTTALNHNAPPGGGQNFQSPSRPEEGKTTIGTRSATTMTELNHNAPPGGGQNFQSPSRPEEGKTTIGTVSAWLTVRHMAASRSGRGREAAGCLDFGEREHAGR
ncbi:hypothetical protein BKA62DRAFT_675162 [Auriculariales sp. MPI-PUGE-AT-0066]|nr:hypothetical protein BKA62DRAFT_675162 [Auriculariales sp. MPI-PUGE-AT-0066]